MELLYLDWLAGLGYLLTNATALLVTLHTLVDQEKRRQQPSFHTRSASWQAILVYERLLAELRDEQICDRLLLLIQRRQLTQL